MYMQSLSDTLDHSWAATLPGHVVDWDVISNATQPHHMKFRSADDCRSKFENLVSSFPEYKEANAQPSDAKPLGEPLKKKVKGEWKNSF